MIPRIKLEFEISALISGKNTFKVKRILAANFRTESFGKLSNEDLEKALNLLREADEAGEI